MQWYEFTVSVNCSQTSFYCHFLHISTRRFEQPLNIAIIFPNQPINCESFRSKKSFTKRRFNCTRSISFRILASSRSNLCNSCNRHVIIGGMFYCLQQHLRANNRRLSPSFARSLKDKRLGWNMAGYWKSRLLSQSHSLLPRSLLSITRNLP